MEFDGAVPEITVRYSDDPTRYRREWLRRKRAMNPEYRERGRIASRKWIENNLARHSYSNTRRAAIRRGYEWAIEGDHFYRLIASNCAYCGVPPAPIHGLDRIDNAQGYLPSNVAPACADCNYAKRKMSSDEFLAWARRLVFHNLYNRR